MKTVIGWKAPEGIVEDSLTHPVAGGVGGAWHGQELSGEGSRRCCGREKKVPSVLARAHCGPGPQKAQGGVGVWGSQKEGRPLLPTPGRRLIFMPWLLRPLCAPKEGMTNRPSQKRPCINPSPG